MQQPQPFEIVAEANGMHGSDGARVMTLLDGDGRMFKRRAIKGALSAAPQNVEFLVVELGGVFVYMSEAGVVVTRKDLAP